MSKGKELQVSEKKEVRESKGEATYEGRMYVPQVDIFETEEGLTLRADLPGVKRDSIDIDLREGILTLTARPVRKPEGWRTLYREHDIGGYFRRFTLGERIDQAQIKASFENGVLEVELPKVEAHKPRRIEIR